VIGREGRHGHAPFTSIGRSGADRSERAHMEDGMEPIFSKVRKILAYLLSFSLTVATIPAVDTWSQSAQPQVPASGATSPNKASSSYTGQGATLTTEELDSLVSLIALYPEALVAQILSAATFPDQIAVANYWVEQNKNLTGQRFRQFNR